LQGAERYIGARRVRVKRTGQSHRKRAKFSLTVLYDLATWSLRLSGNLSDRDTIPSPSTSSTINRARPIVLPISHGILIISSTRFILIWRTRTIRAT